jgi:hypothetical protein
VKGTDSVPGNRIGASCAHDVNAIRVAEESSKIPLFNHRAIPSRARAVGDEIHLSLQKLTKPVNLLRPRGLVGATAQAAARTPTGDRL